MKCIKILVGVFENQFSPGVNSQLIKGTRVKYNSEARVNWKNRKKEIDRIEKILKY